MTRLTRNRAAAGLALLLVVLVALEAVLVPHGKPRFPWHELPGYAAAIGLGACVVVVVASKALGRLVLQRPERDDD